MTTNEPTGKITPAAETTTTTSTMTLTEGVTGAEETTEETQATEAGEQAEETTEEAPEALATGSYAYGVTTFEMYVTNVAGNNVTLQPEEAGFNGVSGFARRETFDVMIGGEPLTYYQKAYADHTPVTVTLMVKR